MPSPRAVLAQLATLTLLGTLALAAQAPESNSAPRFGEKVEVREVLVDALVTDQAGNVIVGLGPSDFSVKENGHEVSLTGITFYSNRRLLEGTEAAVKKGIHIEQVPENRYFVLFFDDQRHEVAEIPNILTQQLEAGRRAKAFVADQLLRNDWVAVASYNNKLVIYQDFTNDRALLSSAIDEATQGKEKEGNWPSRQAPAGEGPSLLARLPQGDDLGAKSRTIYAAFERLAEATTPIVGRKNIIFYGRGFGDVREFAQYRPDPRYYDPMMHALNSANVAVYTLDLMPPGTHHTLSNAMNQLAQDTGGQYFWEIVNFSTPLVQITRANNGYYLLSYRSEHPAGKSGYQEVQVKTTNPEFKVTARKGYNFGP
jgi:VWFA-related protein